MTWTPAAVSFLVLALMYIAMLIEMRISVSNERALRARGAIEPADDVYRAMSWSYPVSFLAMGLEGGLFGPPPGITTAIGVAVLVVAKAVKYWAIHSLGSRWSFRVLVLPGVPLVTRGPYAYLRHPNYVGVIGELLGVAVLVGAPATGAVAVVVFGILIKRRTIVEDRALAR
jgi:methyltransferase